MNEKEERKCEMQRKINGRIKRWRKRNERKNEENSNKVN